MDGCLATDPAGAGGGGMRPDLRALLERWQDTLRLRDWRIQIDYVPNLATPDGRPCTGLCTPFVDAKRARILIRDPQTPATKSDPSVEETLIHELLHLHFAPLAENTGAGIAAEEQAVWAITEAIASVKDVGVRARLARAFVNAAQKHAPQPRRGERTQQMDPIVIAALRAALTAEDPKAAIEALLAQLEGGGSEGGPPAQQAAGEPPPEEQPRPALAPTAQAPARAAIAPTAAPTQLAPLAPSSPTRRTTVPASSIVSRKEFDRFRVERLLDKRPDLTEAQRSFAIEQPYDFVEGWLKVTPAPTTDGGATTTETTAPGAAPPAARAARPALGTAPTQGPRAQRAPVDPVMQEIDRRMGIPAAVEQTVQRDPVTGRLTISSLQPVRVTPSKGGA